MEKWTALRAEVVSLIMATLTRECGGMGCHFCRKEAERILCEYDQAFNERWVCKDAFVSREHP